MKPSFVILFIATMLSIASPMAICAEDMHMPPDTSSPELEMIKRLEGRWTATTSMFGKPNERVYIEYEVTSAGSAVLERIFPGTPHEMISVYYDDKGKLAMTHYCMLRNRPTLKLKSSTPDTIELDVKKISGLKSKDHPAMGGVTIHFKDKNHIVQTCKAKGKDAGDPVTIEYTRVR